MLYKTMVLELLQQRPDLHEQLRSKRRLLEEMERYSRWLKSHHEAWKDHLSRSRPGSDPAQIASEAMEIALQELVDRLDSESPLEGSEPL